MKEKFKNKFAYFANSAVNPILIIICFLLTIIIAINVAMLITAFQHPDSPPSAFGYSPLVMGETDNSIGLEASTFLLTAKNQAIKIGSLVAYRYFNLSLLGRIDNITNNSGVVNLLGEEITLNDTNYIGKVVYTNLHLGQFLMFTQTKTGMLIFLIIPLILVVVMQEHWFIRKKPKEIVSENQMEEDLIPLENQISFDDLLEELKQISLNKANEPIKNKSLRERRKELWKRQRKGPYGG